MLSKRDVVIRTCEDGCLEGVPKIFALVLPSAVNLDIYLRIAADEDRVRRLTSSFARVSIPKATIGFRTSR
jgi:hypothetical protein